MQGWVMSTYLFNVYMDELNLMLAESKPGCQTGGEPVWYFSCADNLVIVAAAARALKAMLVICGEFYQRNYIEFSASKSVVLVIVLTTINILIKPDVFLEIVHYRVLNSLSI